MSDPGHGILQRLRRHMRLLRREVLALYLAIRHPACPWYAKALAAGIVAYALSPIDLIPDFIPVLGYLDDLIILPLGVLAVRGLIPTHVLAECRETAARPGGPTWAGVHVATGWKLAGGILIAALWLLCIMLLARWCWPRRS